MLQNKNAIRERLASLNKSIYRGIAIGATGLLVCALGFLAAHFFYSLGFIMMVIGAAAVFAGFCIHLLIFFNHKKRG